MRILLLTPTFLPVWGGAERLLYEVFTRLARRHTIQALVPHPPTAAVNPHGEALLSDLPFPVARYEERHAWDHFRGRRYHRGFVPPFGLSAVPAALAEAGAFHPDVLSVFYGIPTGLAGLVARWRHRVPLVLSYIGRDVPGPDTPTGWAYYQRRLARAADETTYITDYCRRAIFGNGTAGPGVVVGNGVQTYPAADPGRVEAMRRELGIDEGVTVLLALQRLSVYKGVDVLVRAMTHLADRRCVLLVSGDGADRGRLEAIASDEGAGDSVRFLGFVPEADMPALWGLTDIFVFHSYHETFGMVLSEAMHAGKAVVSVDSTAIPEVVTHGRDGLLVPPGDPAAMADAIRVLVDDPARRQSMAAAGRERAERDFDWDTVTRAYESAFESAAGGRTGAP